MTRPFFVTVLLVGSVGCDDGAALPLEPAAECLPLRECDCFRCIDVVCGSDRCTDAEGRMGAEGYVLRESQGRRRYLRPARLTESCHAPCPPSEPPRCVREAGSCRRADPPVPDRH